MTASLSAGPYVLARPARMSLESLARRCGLHPDLVRRFAALGLLTCHRDALGDLWFDASAVANVARIQRLRLGLGLNYASIGLVLDLLDRIEELESTSRRRRTLQWTSTV